MKGENDESVGPAQIDSPPEPVPGNPENICEIRFLGRGGKNKDWTSF